MAANSSLNVAVLGASDRPERYSYQAVEMLSRYGHRVFPVTPRSISLTDVPVYHDLTSVPEPIHTVTLYVNPKRLETLTEEIVGANPNRVIFNPGTEHAEIESRFRDAGIRVVKACTLVLLKTDQFITA